MARIVELENDEGFVDGLVDLDKSRQSWAEGIWFDGHNHISKATDSQWNHQTLYLTDRGKYCLVTNNQQRTRAHLLAHREAAIWLLQNGHEELPQDLMEFGKAKLAPPPAKE